MLKHQQMKEGKKICLVIRWRFRAMTEELIKVLDKQTRLYRVEGTEGGQYVLKSLDNGEYIALFHCDEKDGEPERMVNYYKNIKECNKK